MSLCPVILAGGGGTRLWPLSRRDHPKQFLRLFGENTMLQDTLLRCDGLAQEVELLDLLVVCNDSYRFIVQEQAQQVDKTLQPIILEPEGRNTAPALTIAAVSQLENDPVMVMMPADHLIKDKEALTTALLAGYSLADKGGTVTFGIKPDQAETGYGYIHVKEPQEKVKGVSSYRIVSFTEKPNKETAEEYLKTGEYFWNSGIFMMKASVWCEQMEALCPDIYELSKAAYIKGNQDGPFYRLDKESFLACDSDSIDYAVMEKLDHGQAASSLIVLNASWSDIGAWGALWEQSTKDSSDNVISGDVIQEDTRNTLINSNHRLVAVLGCDDLAIVETADVVMVARKDRAQDVKNIVDNLKKDEREECINHRRVNRPWGSYESIDTGSQFQVKRITVDPGKKLSLQLHHKRSEHWVVVKGIATVTQADKVFELQENESTFIPIGVKHRLENKTQEPLEIIEVQVGDYLGEDDIVRFDDDFGRHQKS